MFGILYVNLRRTTFSLSFTAVHTKVAPPSHQCFYLSSLFSYFIQNDAMFQRLSRDVGFKKLRPILLLEKLTQLTE